jgi:hypothetical protein
MGVRRECADEILEFSVVLFLYCFGTGVVFNNAPYHF